MSTVKPAIIEGNSLKCPRIPAMVKPASPETWISRGFITLSSYHAMALAALLQLSLLACGDQFVGRT
jgi:hypothetical protein